jgi:phage shock protein E
MEKIALVISLTLALFSSNFAVAEAGNVTVWIDVRSSVEHMVDSIEGDPLISHSEIVAEVTVLYPDTETEIKLYCLSGGRAGQAKLALEHAGYTNVSNVGGIEDARKLRHLAP